MDEENRPVRSMADMMKEIVVPQKKQRQTPHDLAATVDEIQKVVHFKTDDKKYGYKYWLGVVKRTKVTYSDIFGILKEVENADAKFPRGQLLTVILYKRIKK